MKTIYWSILLSILAFNAYPQDLAYCRNGDIAHRTISDGRSMVFSGYEVVAGQTFTEVYGNRFMANPPTNQSVADSKSLPLEENPRNALTIRMLQGGESLIGFDYEYLATDHFGLQFVSGIVGIRAGVNLHFRPTIRSSFVSVQYYHQGLGDSFVQSAIGPSFGYRGQKWFTLQVGFDYLLDKGPKYESEQEPVIFTYALGIYFPW